jgi:hypothetical protein
LSWIKFFPQISAATDSSNRPQVIGKIYTGGVLVLDTSNSVADLNSEVLFKQVSIS